jgi:hypothetical protein
MRAFAGFLLAAFWPCAAAPQSTQPVAIQLTGARLVAEPPSAANQFDRVVLRNASAAAIRSMVIRWRVTK